MAGAALSQGQVQIAWQVQDFRKVKCREFVAGAALSQGQVQISWQAQHLRKVKCRIRGRRSTFARSSIDCGAGAALSQGQVQISWQAQGAALSQGQVQFSRQAQHLRKVKYRFRGKRSTFASLGTDR